MTKWKKVPVALGRHYSGKQSVKAQSIGNKKHHVADSVNKSSTSGGEFELLVAIVYGEANSCSDVAWRAVGHVIMNRIGNHEWSKLNTVTAIITQKYAFEAYHKTQFNIAEKYLVNKTENKKPDILIERMKEILKPVYNKTDPDNTSGAILYFSPKAQKALGREKPVWASSSKLMEVKVDGLEAKDDFKFYKYKPKPKTRTKTAKSAKTKKK